jgi:DNA-binding SARP family transcriptional activator/ABC-type glycerol-3-phosphate transport system substrate-binding protein
MDFRILGPLEVSAGDGSLQIGGRRQRTVLAVLLLNANRTTSTDAIIDAVWGDDPPATARRSIQVYVSRLKKAFGDGRIASVDPGYRLRVEDGELDADRFTVLATAARTMVASDPRGALREFDAALALWRGPAMSDLVDDPGIRSRSLPFDEERMAVVEDRFDLELVLGHHEAVVGSIERSLSEHPYRERLWGQLMIALYRSGRQADALKAYGRARGVLVGDLGIDPSPELRALEERILNQDASLDDHHASRPNGIDPASIRNPYKGLAAFTESDADDFFGRDHLIATIVDRVAAGHRLVAVIGPSGCGKSSVVGAGVIPALRNLQVERGTPLRVMRMEPGEHPFEALELAMVGQGEVDRDELLDTLESGPTGIVEAICRTGDPEQPVLLVVDQFEDLFTVTTADVRDRFLEALARVASCPMRDITVMLALRADFYDRPLRYPTLAEPFVKAMVTVTPLDAEELRSAITEPASRIGVTLEPLLVERLVADVQREPAALPQLQYALMRLFDARTGDTITSDDYKAEGGMRGILARRAESAYLALSRGERAIAQQVFFLLVAVGNAGPVTRRRAPLDEITALGPSASEVLDRFGGYRLMGFDRDPISRRPTVSLVHEALIGDWERLRSWVALARADLQLRESLDVEAHTWRESGSDPDYLLAGSHLEQFEEWNDRAHLVLTDDERIYLEASLDRRRREIAAEVVRTNRERSLEARAHRRAIALATVMSVAAVVAAVLALMAINQSRNADRHAAVAAHDRQIALDSEARSHAALLVQGSNDAIGSDPQRSLLLALHAVRGLQESNQVITNRTVEALHLAIQAARIPYPPDSDHGVVIEGPGGRVGTYVLPLVELVELARSGTHRMLTKGECDTYFAGGECPTQLPEVTERTKFEPLLDDPEVPKRPLSGTSIHVLSPWSGEEGRAFAADLARFTSRTGIKVAATALGLGSDDVLGSYDIVGITFPLGASAYSDRDFMDVGAYLDDVVLNAEHHDYLLDMMTTQDPLSSHATALRGVPLSVSVKSLVWYPAAAFLSAGYSVPKTWDELVQLTEQMVDDGHTPWCVAESGTGLGGWAATDFVEDLVLRGAGLEVYDRWVDGDLKFNSATIRHAFERYGELILPAGHVYGGTDYAIDAPTSDGLVPMQSDVPGCWLHHQGSLALRYLPAHSVRLGQMAYFVMPSIEPAHADTVLGSAVFAAAVTDRPEVRELMRFLAGPGFGVELAQSSGSGFIAANRMFDRTYNGRDSRVNLRVIAHDALETDRFRFDGSVAMGIDLDVAFRAAMISYLRGGFGVLPRILDNLDDPPLGEPDSRQ